MMATYHCKLNKGKNINSLAHANYILREGKYSAERSGREDLVYKESGNMPDWANSPQEFWKAAGIYERVNGVAYFELEIALPNELSLEENIKITQAYVKEVVGDKPYTFAIHDKPASLKEEVRQPHAHIMFSERVALKDVVYTREQFFKRYNAAHPERGGAKKDTRFTSAKGTETILEVRKKLEKIINQSYEKHNIAARVSAATLKAQYNDAIAKNDKELARFFDREPEKHLGPKVVEEIKRNLQNCKTVEEKEKYYFKFAPKKVLAMFYRRQYKETVKELAELNRDKQRLAESRAEIEKEIAKLKEIAEQPVTTVAVKEAAVLVDRYIRTLSSEQERAESNIKDIRKFIFTERQMLMYAQSVYTRGETKKLIKELNSIKREEKQYQSDAAELAKNKPTGFNPIAHYRYAEKKLELEKRWEEITAKRTRTEQKVDYINKELEKPGAAAQITKMVEGLRYKNGLRQERLNSFKEYNNQLNKELALCYALRRKLNEYTYAKDKSIRLPDKVYTDIKVANIAKAQNIIHELRSAIAKMESNHLRELQTGHFLARSYDEDKNRDGFER